jgi:MYXO-CTERM domain-containing protein
VVKNRTIAKTAAVAFGAAMSSMYAVPDLNADIVGITFSPGAAPFGNLQNVQMSSTGGNIGSFSQWNDSIGKTFIPSGIQSWGTFAASASLSVNQAFTFGGTAANFGASAVGTAYIGFKSNAGNVGWFSIVLGGTGPIQFGTLGSEYGNAGETLTIGGTVVSVPEPQLAGLAVLALGAVGLRRRRRA